MDQTAKPPSQPQSPAQPPIVPQHTTPPPGQKDTNSSGSVPPQSPPQGPAAKPPAQPKPHTPNRLAILWTGLAMFILGLTGGILLFMTYPKQTDKPPTALPVTTPVPTQIALPEDTVKIEECVDNKGTLYARTQDLPDGPIYMVHQKKLIGMEFVLDQTKLAAGDEYKNLNTMNLKIDHISTSYTQSSGSAIGDRRTNISLYLIDAKTAGSIKCKTPAAPSPESSPSSGITEAISPSTVVTITNTPSIQPSLMTEQTTTVSPGAAL